MTAGRGSRDVGAVLALGLAVLGGCASIGAELRPGRRAVAEGWMVSLHQRPGGRYQAMVQHPSGRFAGPAGAVRGRLVGEPIEPYTWGVTRTETTASGDGGYRITLERGGGTVESQPARVVEERRELVRTVWDFDRARWASGRAFRLVISAAFGPPDEVVLEIVLGPEPGSSDGVALRILPST
jgi:hypothetical protein